MFSAEIIEANHNKCKAKITAVEQERDKKYHIHLAVAPTKMNDRFETFLEKATEIGLDKITPIICDHSERKVVKINRFERVLQSAMKQSLHYSMPAISEAISFLLYSARTKRTEIYSALRRKRKKIPAKRIRTR